MATLLGHDTVSAQDLADGVGREGQGVVLLDPQSQASGPIACLLAGLQGEMFHPWIGLTRRVMGTAGEIS